MDVGATVELYVKVRINDAEVLLSLETAVLLQAQLQKAIDSASPLD